jgi:P-type Mg2+ transporter
MNPFVGILVLLAVASYLTEYVFAPPQERDLTTVIIISVLVFISVALTFIQEYQANQAAEQLLSLVQNRTMVERRDSGRSEIVTTHIVPGDIVHLGAGDIIPADVRLLATNNLSINEAALTGESLPIEKNENLPPDFDPRRAQEYIRSANALDLDNIGFMGTDVVSGTARAVVLATGSYTYFGAMSKELVGHHPATSFDRGVRSVSLLLIRFMLVMVPIIFLINGIIQGNWLQALLFGLAVAVGLTPEMLPTIITANLAKGTLEMARRKTIVKRLNAIQNLGAMNVLCTDKTGTLTEDTVAMTSYINIQGQADAQVLEYTYLNSSFQTGLRNPLDEAVLAHEDAVQLAGLEARYRKVDEVPFETARRRMSVIVSNGQGAHTVITKGAVAEMTSISTHILENGSVAPLDDRLRRKVEQTAHDLNDAGLRVLVVAYKQDGTQKQTYTSADENGMVLAGFIGFLDPPKETAGPAIKALNRLGIRVVVITGDNEIATRRVCREIDFEIQGLLEGQRDRPHAR